MSDLLTAKNLKKHYRSGTRTLEVLSDVSINVERGQSVAVVGASGVGKSTLLHLLGALDQFDEGSVILQDSDFSEMNDRQLAEMRNRRIGYIYQFHHLLPEFSALENVMIPAIMSGGEKSGPTKFALKLWNFIHPSAKSRLYAKQRERATQLLRDVGLEERMEHRPTKLSGGEQQRVALARALVNDPDIVLADEPTGNLDLKTGDRMLDLIIRHTRNRGKAIVLVTHNPEIASRLDVRYELIDGTLHKLN